MCIRDRYSILFFFTLFSWHLAAQSPIGTWESVDNYTGKARSYVEIYEENGQLFGKITKLLDVDSNTLCDQCEGDKKNAPILGMVIIEKVKPYRGYWRKGKILDPTDGTVYGCSLWLEDGKLKVKVKHWTGLSQTQTWIKVG